MKEQDRIFIVPLNNGFDEGDAKSASAVIREIAAQLDQTGFGTATMSEQNYREVWSTITTGVGGIYSATTGELDRQRYASALSQLALPVNEEEQFAAVIMPSIMLRTAELNGKHAVWDGVKTCSITLTTLRRVSVLRSAQ